MDGTGDGVRAEDPPEEDVAAAPDGAASAAAAEPRLGLWRDITDELRWTFSGRKGWLVGVVLNLALGAVYVGVSHYRPGHHDDFRIAGVGTGLALWVLADSINTNQLGSDAERVVRSLDRGDRVLRILALKNAALATLVVPASVTASVVVRLVLVGPRDIPTAVLLDLRIALVWFGLGNLASVVLPYFPMGLRSRLGERRHLVRWIACLVLPYALLYLVVHWVGAVPASDFSRHVLGPLRFHVRGWALVSLAWGTVVWLAGLAGAWLYAAVVPGRLRRDLLARW